MRLYLNKLLTIELQEIAFTANIPNVDSRIRPELIDGIVAVFERDWDDAIKEDMLIQRNGFINN